MSTLNLPEPIAAYFAAEHHPAALAHCFTPHAVMNDFGHRYVGIDAIKAFPVSYTHLTLPTIYSV